MAKADYQYLELDEAVECADCGFLFMGVYKDPETGDVLCPECFEEQYPEEDNERG